MREYNQLMRAWKPTVVMRVGPCFAVGGKSTANVTEKGNITEYTQLAKSTVCTYFILHYEQQMHNYFTNYHTPTCSYVGRVT
jgi:hypothetical protein